MDQLKVGKFIAECRKEKKLTQAQLAEKLCITDKAISKWERGITMPDSSIMLDLCDILEISVNELLCGEKINAEENDKKIEALLLEMTKKEELQRKRLFVNSWLLFFFWMLFFLFTQVLLVVFVDNLLVFVVFDIVCLAIYFGGGCILATMELKAGHYICTNCQHEFEANERFAFNTIIGKPKNWKYHVRCPECNRKVWAKRILPK